MFAASGPSESGDFFRVYFMVFKGFKMVRVGVANFQVFPKFDGSFLNAH